MTDHLFALAHHAYYCGELDAGRRACERLLSLPPVESLEDIVRANRTWYTQTMDELAACRFTRFDVEPAHEGWSLFNPAVTTLDGKLIAIVRSSNYQIVDGQYVMPKADGGVIRTENLLVELREDCTPESVRMIRNPIVGKTDFPVDGLEDCRLRHTQKGLGVSATIRNAAGYDGRCRIATADLCLETATLSNLRVMSGNSPQDHEKNWMPAGASWVYSCYHNGHVVTVEPDPELAGGWQLCQRAKSPPVARAFRGGSQLVPWGDGWLAVIHEVAWLGERRAYEHRFVAFDKHMTIRRVSSPFVFREPRAIEFAAGMAVLDQSVYVTFGVRDAEAWVVMLPTQDVEAMLCPLS